MKAPFEGLLGDTCETRLLQFLLPMYGIEFTMAELVEEIRLTRQSIAKAMNKFADRGMVTIRKYGRTPLYSINEASPLVKRLEDFDNSLIESMVGPEVFRPVREEQRNVVHSAGRKMAVKGTGRPGISYSHHGKNPGEKIYGVASRTVKYSGKKSPVVKK